MSAECPEISLIIPAYKAAKYLAACLESITVQTFTDWELIIVDDGSPDETGMIADSFASADSRIRVIHKENGGVSAARNTGIESARGRYLSFMDADDRLEESYLEELYSRAVESGADITQCSFWLEEEDGKKTLDPNGIDADYRDNTKILDAYFNGPWGDIRISPWSKLFRRETFKDIRYSTKLRIYEDAFYVYECCRKAKTAVSFKKPLYDYIQHEQSATHGRLLEIYPDYFRMYEMQKADLTDNAHFRRLIARREAETALWLMRVVITKDNANEFWNIRKKALGVTGSVLFSSAPLKLKLKLAVLTLMPHLYFAILKKRTLAGNEKT